MTIKVEAFLALEAALTQRLQASLRALTSPLYKGAAAALTSGDHDEAERLVRSLRLGDIYEKNKGYVAYLTNLAMLFGASRVTRNPGTSVVGLGFEKDTAFQLNQVFSQMVGVKAEAFLIASGVQLIAQLRAVTKAETPADPTNPPPKKQPRILRDFQTFMDDSGRAYLDISSSLHTSRVSAFGFTAEAMALGLTEYQINEQLDRRICPVCRVMHGQRFKVREARDTLNIVTRVSDPDELKLLQPWPKQTKKALEELVAMDAAEIVSKNWHVPPYHPKCRGLLSRVGKVPALSPEGVPTKAPDDYQAGKDDFEAMLLPSPSPTGLKDWNTKVKTTPAEVVATVLGTTIEKVLLDAIAKKLKPAVRVKTSTDFVQVSATRPAPKSPKAPAQLPTTTTTAPVTTAPTATTISHSVRFYGPEVVVAVAEVPAGFGWKEYLLGLYLLAQDSGATALTVNVKGADLAYLGFAKVKGSWTLNLTDKEAMAAFLM